MELTLMSQEGGAGAGAEARARWQMVLLAFNSTLQIYTPTTLSTHVWNLHEKGKGNREQLMEREAEGDEEEQEATNKEYFS